MITCYDNVIFGGTFDRLHEGHMNFFKAAVQLVKSGGDIFIGVTTGKLLEKKINK